MRHPKHLPGTRMYGNYSPETLEIALAKIRSGEITQRRAEALYKIPRSTLKNKLSGCHFKNIGRPQALSEDEETVFVDHALVLSQYGFPVTSFDLRCIVKMYLDNKNKIVKVFKNNLPGEDWALNFLRRHSVLSKRTAANIKSSRAKVSPEVINEYFNNIENTLTNVEPSNVWNYDETNLVDDPGQKKVLVKQGSKYPERVMNSSKAANSVMFCGSATGEILPPYIVYKAEHMWTSWTQGGPKGARYNRSKSGWFDQLCFEDWFFSVALPRLKTQQGKKALLGDNLSSHLSVRVLQACEKYNIAFVALPASSTHLTQPLDVAFFRPMKGAWRQILTDWKLKSGDKPVAKDVLPRLLKGMLEKIGMSNNSSLMSGFEKCGIVPLNRNKVLDRIPASFPVPTPEPAQNSVPSPDIETRADSPITPSTQAESSVSSSSFTVTVSDCVLRYLSESRYGNNSVEETPKQKGKKKVVVVPGRSVSSEEVLEMQKNAPKQKPKTKKSSASHSEKENIRPKKVCKRITAVIDSDSENNPPKKVPKRKTAVIVSESDSEIDDPDEFIEIGDKESSSEDEFETNFDHNVGSYVIVEYESEYFPGEVVNVDTDGSAEVRAMVMRGFDWGWPDRADQVWYEKQKILEVIQEPKEKPSNSGRSHRLVFSVPEIAKYRKNLSCL